ncbi:MAG: alpha-2-macroglobulin family protein [Bdellovibrionota bacterium]
MKFAPVFAVLALFSTVPAQAFKAQSFQPEGMVKSPRQARVVFNEAMVPFGDPRGIEPFTVECSAKGKGLWEDSRTWMYEFESELPAGESCAFKGKPALKSEKGTGWEGRSSFSFNTGGPSVIRSEPYEGSTVEQQPAFLLRTDGPVNPASVEKNVYLLVEGLPERIPVKVLSNKTRDEIAHRTGAYYGYSEDEEEGEGGTTAKKKKPNLVAIESSRTLPPGKKIQLIWGKGVASPRGMTSRQDHMIAYVTESEFTATFHCQRENENSACLPIGEMSLSFTSPITSSDAEKIVLRMGKTEIAFEGQPKKSKHGRKKAPEDEVHYLRFSGPFPPNANFTLELPAGLKDERGRTLSNAAKFPLALTTAGYPPLAKFPAAFGIIEAKDPVMPVTVRSVEASLAGSQLEGSKVSLGPDDPAKLMNWIYRLHRKRDSYVHYEGEKAIDNRGDSLLAKEKGSKKFELPKPGGGAAFEVMGIPLGEKGFHVVEIESKLLGTALLGAPKPMYVASGALVTDMAVHLKWGAESSLVWVTSLESGKPVKGARLKAADCTGKIVWTGKTGSDGTAVSEEFPSAQKVASCNGSEFSGGLVVLAEKDGDFSLVHSSWDNGIESWRFHVSTGGREDETMAHTVFDRTLLRAGQTVHMKHFLREGFLRGIRYRKGDMPKSLVILHSGGHKIVMPILFDSNGVAESEWKIPNDADLGGYSVYLTMQGQKEAKGRNGEEDSFTAYGPGVYDTGSFRVEEFRLPVMSGTLQWPKGNLLGAENVEADLSVRYLSGGGAMGLPVKVRARATRLDGTTFPEFEGFTFANGGVKTGRFSRGEARSHGDKGEKTFPDQNLSLDQGGGARVTVRGLPTWDQPTQVALEAEFHDPNGEIQTVSRTTTSYPSAALVGIQPDGWVSSQEKVKFKIAVAGPDGKPLSGRKVKANWLEKESFSHRKRIVGGFYAYENFEEIKERGEACEGRTNEKGILACEGKAPASGNLVIVAETDEGGKKSRAHHELFVAGADDWWFSQENDDRVDFLPEKKAYEPGETARLQVRSPFREATALVTVEREGVIDHFIAEVDGKNPVIEVPVKDSYAPNVFISALLVRGRVGDPKATALVDLARPSHKLGLAAIQVGWKAHRLKVSVSADRAEYRVREKAKVKVHVERDLDGKPASNGKVLLVAVDEALLELMPNQSWDLLTAMMGERSLKVQTSTAQSQVIGKRHFGVKALPPGGGGGKSSARELFDTLLFWKASLPLDSGGNAEAEVSMNDSLSSFKLVAVASEEADRFGTGSRSVRTRQDLMLFSGVSPLAREGDKTNPEVTLRNASDHSLSAEVKGAVNGEALSGQKVELSAGASKTISWPYSVPNKATPLVFEFEAKSGDAHDSLKITQKVEPALRESVLQGTLERVEGRLTMPVQQAKGSLPDTGGITVKLERTLANNLGGVKRYMEEYQYGCLEQLTSKAVALRDPARWKAIVGNISNYIDGAGLLKYFPQSIWGSDTLTTYVLAVSNEAGYEIPENELRRVIVGLQGFVTGTYYYAGFLYPAADLSVRKLAAMEALSRYQSFNPKYLSLIQIEPEQWPITAVIDWINLLRREQNIPERVKRLEHAEQILRAKLEWRGTTVAFKGGAPLWWLMNSMDEDANRLLVEAATDDTWNTDIGRLVRGTIGRMKGGHWDLTTANAWGVLAMERFSQRHEKDPVSGKTDASLGGKTETAKWDAEKEPAAMAFPWPKAKSDLVVTHNGSGKPWALLEARAAVRLAEPIFKGYQLKRTVTPVDQRVKGRWSKGDVYRVTLDFQAPADMTWVVVSDPIPAGATVLGSGLGNDSSALTKGEKHKDWNSGIEERSFSGFRSYYEWLPRGSHQLEYTVRLNGAGTFQMPNSRVEAMYAPEMYAETPNDAVTVAP